MPGVTFPSNPGSVRIVSTVFLLQPAALAPLLCQPRGRGQSVGVAVPAASARPVRTRLVVTRVQPPRYPCEIGAGRVKRQNLFLPLGTRRRWLPCLQCGSRCRSSEQHVPVDRDGQSLEHRGHRCPWLYRDRRPQAPGAHQTPPRQTTILPLAHQGFFSVVGSEGSERAPGLAARTEAGPLGAHVAANRLSREPLAESRPHHTLAPGLLTSTTVG